jgi:hypothetical protein
MGYSCGSIRQSYIGDSELRLFITSYQKSGTHQIMPMFSSPVPHVVDRSWNCWINAPERYGLGTVGKGLNQDGVDETVLHLSVFPEGNRKAFGHISYLPEFAEILEETETKVLFNIRDPRDVIVAEYENAQRHFEEHRKGHPLYHFLDREDGVFLFDKEDPISDLIILAAARWPRWLGWLDHDFVLPIKYEDLRLSPKPTVEKIIGFLNGFECTGVASMVQDAQPKPRNPTFRRGVPGEWHETFEHHHIELAEELLGDIIERMGYIL